jgi:hypothetical protein
VSNIFAKTKEELVCLVLQFLKDNAKEVILIETGEPLFIENKPSTSFYHPLKGWTKERDDCALAYTKTKSPKFCPWITRILFGKSALINDLSAFVDKQTSVYLYNIIHLDYFEQRLASLPPQESGLLMLNSLDLFLVKQD